MERDLQAIADTMVNGTGDAEAQSIIRARAEVERFGPSPATPGAQGETGRAAPAETPDEERHQAPPPGPTGQFVIGRISAKNVQLGNGNTQHNVFH